MGNLSTRNSMSYKTIQVKLPKFMARAGKKKGVIVPGSLREERQEAIAYL